MAAEASAPSQSSFMVTIPKVDLKKFKGIFKALGWTFESMDDYEYSREVLADRMSRADKELSEGQCTSMQSNESGEEFINRILCATR